MLGGIANKGVIVTTADLFARLNVTAEIILSLPTKDPDLVRPFIDGPTMSETYTLLYYVAQLQLKGTETLIVDAQDQVSVIQSSILLSSVLFGVVLVVLFFQIWRPFENMTKNAYHAPFRLLLLVPSNLLISNNYVRNFLKTNIPIEATSNTKIS
eukprot:TRINITY_DN5684_c0_g1_i3.p1 TRINITY_DN5684_c0_g1~~TRINITY_DN5684_c0_g1_i3.p1  ORF type:complete len:155 (-),score=6.49 TRINITY_DN5684_c0_g1_i3:152-616(-)